MCFQRGFDLIKTHFRSKCGTVSRRNQKISLVNGTLMHIWKSPYIFEFI